MSFDGLKAINDMNALQEKLNREIESMRMWGIEYAKTDRDYKVALMTSILELRAQDYPATLINQIAYGKVGEERFLRNKSEVMYKASIENVNAIKLQMRILDNQIQREWGRE